MSVPFRVRDVLDWTGARLRQGDPECCFSGVSIDSRRVGTGELFVAIVGPHHDAHAFLGDALAAGAAGLLVEREHALPAEAKPELPVLAVDDTTRALGALASGHRAGFGGPLVAITGSNGKTTTKEMCAAILSASAPCLKNEGNLNNLYGLPLTLLRREPSHAGAVVELGMNHRGEIAALAAIARPTVGVITNVGTAHIGNLGSQEEIALEKGDLVAALDAAGTAVLNADDPRVAAQAERTAARVLTFGLGEGADLRPERVQASQRGFAFELETRKGRIPVEVLGLGDSTLANALAAAAGALAAGASPGDVEAGLAAYRPVPGRLVPHTLPGGGVLVDDTYNANPESMAVALRLVAARRGRGRALAVLGDMGELGDAEEAAHRETGALAASLGVDLLFAVGARAASFAEGARAAGLAEARIRVASDPEEIAPHVLDALRPGDWVLVKGSRAMRMERLVKRLAPEAR